MAEVNPMPHAPDIEKQPFIILTKATQEFGQMLKSRFAAMAVDQGDFRVVTLYARPTMGLTADSSFAEVLAMYRRDEIVNQKPIKATVYIGGISTGFTQWNQQAENSDGRVGLKGYSPAHVSTLSEKTLRKIATKMIPDKMPNKQAPSY